MGKKTINHKRFYHFLGPTFWGLWLLFGFLRICSLLPYPALQKMARGLGKLLFKLQPKRVHFARVNLKLCYPEKSDVEREHILHESFYFMAMAFFELALAWWASDKRIERLVDVHDVQKFIDVLKQGRGAIGISAHFTQVELFMRVMGKRVPVCVFYRRQKNDLFEWYSVKKRLRFVEALIERKELGRFFKALDDNKIIAYLPDQDFGRERSVFAPFFGVQAATISALSKKLYRPNTPFITGYLHYTGGKTPYTVQCDVFPVGFPSRDAYQDACFINSQVEAEIRQYPEQYMWQHRRFKTRPEGEPYPY